LHIDILYSNIFNYAYKTLIEIRIENCSDKHFTIIFNLYNGQFNCLTVQNWRKKRRRMVWYLSWQVKFV